ncbi:MAG: enoyl-CoA hydratase/isomerase family protein [Gammaproteobacteria bacterium]|nr:enoyl-CoA hydratase/isomerase family protein [Gammaproteobacteria bacterium]MYD79674.1 enoyl-CoA hydratase/isomerase family protein [Gammaproteobacteria bacterium]
MRIAQDALARKIRHLADAEDFCVFNGVSHVLVEVDGSDKRWKHMPACPLIGIGGPTIAHSQFDVLVEDSDQATKICSAIEEHPIASATFVQLLRHNENSSIENALFAESLSFSTLQHSSEFRSWLATNNSSIPNEAIDEEIVLIDRSDGTLRITLNKPNRHNAWSAAMRDSLCEALVLAIEDPTVKAVEIRGVGPSFCSGGDLSEFGLAQDAGVAHVSRIVRNAGYLLESIREKVSVHVHGACIGAGIEVPAFASLVDSSEDAYFQLPEVQMGLVPGAGGTASILRRIGKHRMAWMGLTGETITAQTALSWGLIDKISA